MSGDRGNLVGGTSGLGQTPACRFAQAMRCSVLESGVTALLGEPGREAFCGEGTAVLVDEESQMLSRRGSVDRGSLLMGICNVRPVFCCENWRAPLRTC